MYALPFQVKQVVAVMDPQELNKLGNFSHTLANVLSQLYIFFSLFHLSFLEILNIVKLHLER